MKAAPAFFGGSGGSGSTFVGPLDAWTSNLWLAASIDRLLASHTGHCLTARDSTSGALQDIGFNSDGTFNSTALAAFLGSHNGTARDWNNQQGVVARSWTQPTAASQPAIATAGTWSGKLAFDGSNDVMAGGTSGTPSAITVFIRGLLRSTSGTQGILEHSANYNSNDACVGYYDSGALSVGCHKVSPAGYGRSDFNGKFPNSNVHAWRFDRSQVTSNAMCKLFINGSVQTRDTDGSTGTLPSGNFGAAAWSLGARFSGTIASTMDFHTVLIYEAAISDADIASISTIISGLA